MRVPKLRFFTISAVLFISLALVLPTLLSEERRLRLPGFMQGNEISLGLDLKGGAYILLEADTDAVVRERYAVLKDIVRRELRGDREKGAAMIPYANLTGTASLVGVNVKEPKDVAEAIRRLRDATGGEVEIEESGGRLRLFYSASAIDRIKSGVMQSSIEIVRRRVDSLGNKEPSIQRQGDRRIMVQLPGVDDPDRVKELVGKTAKMTFHLVDEEAMKAGSVGLDGEVVDGIAIKKRVAVSGESLTDSRVAYDQRTGAPAVTTTFDSLGAREFAKLTGENVGRRFAIVLDGRVLSAPTIQEPIPGGHGQITGNFTAEQAGDLSTMLRSGALPTELSVVEERTVGAGLGADSIAKGSFASVLGMAVVLVFMIAFYGVLGVFSDVALVFNVLLIFAGLALTGATLTLPGIAGIALNIGMAVDANILVFERMREERRLGMSTIRSVENGFANAFSAIIDSNLTTIAVGLIMFQFGTGPIKGFAVTLVMGVLASLFTNITCLRFMLEVWAKNGRPKTVDI
ncbi:MAG: protein translocase subunit SecD [Rickettsiales bacterium]|jgi:protein-export membrane protein SecD|nr:protein translocase subunit SecD [Rickettsiales bacterium]